MSEPEEPLSRRAARGGSGSRKRANRNATGTTVTGTVAALDSITGEPVVTGGGIGGFIGRHPVAWLSSAIAVVFLLLGTGAVFAGASVGSGDGGAASAAEVTVDDARAVPEEIPAASRLRTCSIAALATDTRLAEFKGSIMNANTGEVLFDRGAADPARTGSVLKVLTAAAALSALGPDYQISTRVLDGSRPGTIVLVGGGDPTLSRISGESFYSGAPKLSALASAALSSYESLHPGVPITEVVLDATLWDVSDRWDPAWDRKGIREGYHSEVTALQVDGDRNDPTRSTSPRSTDAIARVGQAFAEAIGQPGVTITRGAAVSTTVLAEVKSQPVSTLVGQMLLQSDNALGEMLARLVSVKLGLGGSAESLKRAIPAALELYELPTTGMVIRDGSGLSRENAVPAAYISQLMIKVRGGGQNLSFIYGSLPVAGKTGTLASRFTGSNAIARGAVIAKTGWIETAYTLAGAINSADGTPLTFAFYAIGDGISSKAKEALDSLATGAYRCGDNLSNN